MEALEPDHEVGHSEAQMRSLLGDAFSHFEDYMMYKTAALDADGRIFYVNDVRRYLAGLNSRTPGPG